MDAEDQGPLLPPLSHDMLRAYYVLGLDLGVPSLAWGGVGASSP